MIDFHPSATPNNIASIDRADKSTRSETDSVSHTDETQTSPSLRQSMTKSVSDQAKMLESMRLELQSMPDVDLEKVNTIRQQLQSGEFELDLSELAQTIKQTHDRD